MNLNASFKRWVIHWSSPSSYPTTNSFLYCIYHFICLLGGTWHTGDFSQCISDWYGQYRTVDTGKSVVLEHFYETVWGRRCICKFKVLIENWSISVLMHGSRDKFQGGGVQAWRPENSLGSVFLVLNLFYNLQRGSIGFITEKTILFQGSRGVQQGGGSPNANSYRNTYHLWFSRGVRTPYSPILRTWYWYMYIPGIWYCISREWGYVAPVSVNAPVSENVDNNGRYCSCYCKQDYVYTKRWQCRPQTQYQPLVSTL